MDMLNLGCGNIYHTDWVNIDINSSIKDVIKYDIKKKLPFGDNCFDVVYCSHTLEHFEPGTGEMIIKEMHRVLKKGGIVRLLVPDLEAICLNYIKYLNEASGGKESSIFRYDYTILELFDQIVRTESGGRMGRLWREGEIKDMQFIKERSGIEAINCIENRNSPGGNENAEHKKKFTAKVSKVIINYKNKLLEALIKIFYGKRYAEHFKEAMFRSRGEIHLAMYDHFSLSRLLLKCGFKEISRHAAGESRIDGFGKYNFEIVNGEERKPDSLYMEAVKQ